MKNIVIALLLFALAVAMVIACAAPVDESPAQETSMPVAMEEAAVAEALQEEEAATVDEGESTYFYSNGEQIEVEIAPDLIAIVVEDDPELRLGQIPMLFNVERGDEFEAFAQEDVYFIRAEDAVSRDDMLLYQFDLREQDGVAQTGQVLYLPDAEMPIVMTDEFIVRFKDGVSVDDVDALTNDLAAEIIRQNEFVENQYLMRVLPGSNATALDVANSLVENDLVEFAHPNFIVHVEDRDDPNDPLYPQQWHLHNSGQGGGTEDADVDAPEAWDITTGDAGVIIAVIDSGIQINHEDLTPNRFINSAEVDGNLVDDDGNGFVDDVSGWNFYSNSGNTDRGNTGKHGTAVAGVVAARGNNAIGISGMCQQCTILPIARGRDVANHADAFRYAAAMGADIITNSWGYPIGTPNTDDVVAAIDEAATLGRDALGSVVFFAMTNTHEDNCIGEYPDISSLDSVIAVSRATNLDIIGDAGYGDCMEVIAPTRGGTLGITTVDQIGGSGYSDDDYHTNFGGTSSSTPLVAGIVGLMLDLNSNLTREQVERILEESAEKIEIHEASYDEDGFSNTHGFGRANAYRAIVPSVKIAVFPDTVEAGEPFMVRVVGSSLHGLSDLFWAGVNTGIPSLDQAQWHNVVDGSSVVVHEWPNQTIGQAGTFNLCANARTVHYPGTGDGQPHQASEGSGIACAEIEVVPSSTAPDLVVEIVSIDNTMIPQGQEPWTWITYRVSNIGNADTPGGQIFLRDWTNGSPTSGYMVVEGSLLPDGSVEQRFAVGHDDVWPVGDYSLQMEVDYRSLIEEEDETNNFSNFIEFEVTGSSTTGACYPNLPSPILAVTGTEDYEANGREWTRYQLDVTNRSVFPDALFETAPDLPPCGNNDDASRTWVDIYSAAGSRIYGFCALGSSDSLNRLWFAVPRGEAPPDRVYIILEDRRCGITYTSNRTPTR